MHWPCEHPSPTTPYPNQGNLNQNYTGCSLHRCSLGSSHNLPRCVLGVYNGCSQTCIQIFTCNYSTLFGPVLMNYFNKAFFNFRFDSRNQCWTFYIVCWDGNLYLQTKKEVCQRTLHCCRPTHACLNNSRHKTLPILAEQDEISTWCGNSWGCFLIVNIRNTELIKYLWLTSHYGNGNDTSAKGWIMSGGYMWSSWTLACS